MENIEKMEYALSCIIMYDCHEEWLEKLADELEKTDFYKCPFDAEEWGEKFETIDSDFRIWKVKDHSQLAIGEKIDFLSVVDVADHPTEKGGEE